MSVIDKLKGGLIVSCQALEDEPLNGPEIMAAMARAAEEGGAIGIRANGPDDIREIKKVTPLPLIGIYKETGYDSPVFITPTFREARKIAEAGADILAIEATDQPRPEGQSFSELLERIHRELELPVMADVSTVEEGIAAWKAGADLVATTLSGYTDYTEKMEGPNFEFLSRLVDSVEVPVIMEGRINTPEQAKQALDLGAYAVVVGTAITRPQIITARFVDKIKT